MLARHANELMLRLERVHDLGSAEIRKVELLTWYGQQRLTVSIWRDLLDRWEEILEARGKKSPLFVGDAEGVLTLIWAEGLVSQGGWFTDISKRAA